MSIVHSSQRFRYKGPKGQDSYVDKVMLTSTSEDHMLVKVRFSRLGFSCCLCGRIGSYSIHKNSGARGQI